MKRIFSIIIISLLICACDNISHAHKEYYCENGTLQGDVCKVDEIAKVKMVCAEDAELEDGQCKFVEMELDASIGNKACVKGYSFYEKRCISDESVDRIPSATCPEPESDDYIIEQGYLTCFKKKCDKKDSKGKCIHYKDDGQVEPEIKYSCPSGYKYIYWQCRKVYFPSVDYVCPEGELEGKKCIFYDYEDPELVCPEDYKLDEENKQCIKTYYVDASTR